MSSDVPASNDPYTPPSRTTNIALAPINMRKSKEKVVLGVSTPSLIDSGDGFYHCYGVTPGSERKPHSHCIPRVLEVTCTLLEVLTTTLHNKNLYVSVYLKNEFRRKVLKSQIIQIPNTNTNSNSNVEKYELPIDTVFHMQYMHHVKKRIDVLEISIKASKIKRKRDSIENIQDSQTTEKDVFKTFGTVAVNLSYVLQCPVDDLLRFKHVSGDNEIEFDMMTPFTNANDETDIVAKMRVKVISKPLTEEFIRTLLEQKPKKKKYLGISFGKKQPSTPKKSPANISKKDDQSDGEFEDTNSDTTDGGLSIQPTSTLDPKILALHPNNKDKPKESISNNLKLGLIRGLNYLKKKKLEKSPDEDEDTVSPRSVTNKKSARRESSPFIPAALELVSTINEQLDEVFKPKKIRDIIFVNLKTRRGKKFGDFLKRPDGLLRKFTLCTTSNEDLSIAMDRLSQITKNQTYDSADEEDFKIRIMTVGSDAYSNEVLRAALQFFSQTPKQWEPFLFYLVPMSSSKHSSKLDSSGPTGFVINCAGKHNNVLCDYIASKNTRYSQIFATTTNPHDWIDNIEPVMRELERNMVYYLQEATETMKLSISQVLLTTEIGNERNNTNIEKSDVNTTILSPNLPNASSASLNLSTEQEGSQLILPFVNTVQIFNDVLSTAGAEKANNKDKKNLLKRVQNVLQGSKEFNHDEAGLNATNDTDVTVTTPATALPPVPAPITINTDHTNNNLLTVGSTNMIISPATENEEIMVEKKNNKLATDLSNAGNAVELKLDYFVGSNKLTTKHHYQHVTIFKLPNFNVPEQYAPSNDEFTLCTLKSKKNETNQYEKNVTRIICKVEKKKQTACAVVDGVEFNGVKFVSISQQFYSKGFNFIIAVFPREKASKKVPSVDSTGSMKHLLDDNLDDF